MKTSLKTAELIRQRIAGMPVGEPFASAAFMNCGTRASVDQTLSRLVKVAETVARTTGSIIQVHGAEAARRLELSTQVPTQPVFVTSGPTKSIRVGKMEIRLQHVCQRKLALAGRPAGLALAAMWYLGKKEMTPALIEKIRHQLGTSEFEVLKSATNAMPAWMSDAIFRNERTTLHG